MPIRSSLAARLERWWYLRRSPPVLLLPLSRLFASVATLRRKLYAVGLFRTTRLPARVVVVGNIVAGGSGKTPLVAWLARRISGTGVSVAIVVGGYRGASRSARLVTAGSDPWTNGDEAVWLARTTGVPVGAGRDRVAAARLLLNRFHPELILADDGLQHYRLGRDAEVAAVDAARGFGNGAPLPAGPLREPPGRLARVDAVVLKGGGSPQIPRGARVFRMNWRLGDPVPLGGGPARPLAAFRGRRIHALAGIADPEGFFQALEGAGLDLVRHPLADHADVRAALAEIPVDEPVLMTEKDAVKLSATDRDAWRVPLEVAFSDADARALLALVSGRGATSRPSE